MKLTSTMVALATATTTVNGVTVGTQTSSSSINTSFTFLKDINKIQSSISNYHPVLIEGPGRSDSRDAAPIAQRVAECIQSRVTSKNITKPLLIISQGDPVEEGKDAGIASIVNHVLRHLDLKKGLVCLDEHIADYHAKDADRSNVIYEMRYSKIVEIIEKYDPTLPAKIEEKISQRIEVLNEERETEGREKLKYCSEFALLQEMTKFALKLVSGDVTVAHTLERESINKYSVTSFYSIGLELNLIDENQMIFYGEK